MARRIALWVMLLLGAASPISAADADMEAGLPAASRVELSRPDVEPLSPSRMDPPHADFDTWTPSRFEWSRPDVDTHPPVDLPLSHPDVERER